MTQNKSAGLFLLLAFAGFQFGCASVTPSIAHVHVGHAITGANDTAGNFGYFVLAEQQSDQAIALGARAIQPGQTTSQMKDQLKELSVLVNRKKPYGMAEAVREAASHIRYAADSDDASANIKAGATTIDLAIDGIAFRANLINLYAEDAALSTDLEEVTTIATEINKMVKANQNGEDIDGDGTIGNQPREFGLKQIRLEIDAMVNRESPPYTTVDRWYLFNLIRLPSGSWIFRRSGNKSGPGY